MSSLRVLHIVDPGQFNPLGGGGPCTLRFAADVINNLPDVNHDVLVIGTRRDVLLARECGLKVAGWYCPPRALPLSNRSAPARILRRLEIERGPCDAVHGWTPRAAMLASAVLPHVPRICFLDVAPPPGFSSRALQALLGQHNTRVVAANEAVRHACRKRGIAVHQMAVNTPAVDASVIAAEREALRERWGVDEETMVIGAFCEPAGAADARIAIRTISSLRITGRKVRMVMPPGATRCADAKLWGKRLGRDHLLMIDDLAAQPWRIVAGLDAAWTIAAIPESTVRPASSLPLLWCMAAALPIVAEAADAAPEMLVDEETGLLVPPGAIPTILDRLAHCFDEREWAMRLGDAARNDVTEHAKIGTLAQQMAACYE